MYSKVQQFENIYDLIRWREDHQKLVHRIQARQKMSSPLYLIRKGNPKPIRCFYVYIIIDYNNSIKKNSFFEYEN